MDGRGTQTMTIHVRDDWRYDLSISPFEGKFHWNVVRLKIDPARASQTAYGPWIAGGIALTRDEAEREGLAVIDHDFHMLAEPNTSA